MRRTRDGGSDGSGVPSSLWFSYLVILVSSCHICVSPREAKPQSRAKEKLTENTEQTADLRSLNVLLKAVNSQDWEREIPAPAPSGAM